MKLKIIAGHEFNGYTLEERCIRLKHTEQCPMTRAILYGAKESDINQEGYAHQGCLTSGEYDEIKTARNDYEAHCERVMELIRLVAG